MRTGDPVTHATLVSLSSAPLAVSAIAALPFLQKYVVYQDISVDER